MRILTLFLPAVGLMGAVWVSLSNWKVDRSFSHHVFGALLVGLAEIGLILFYAIDPGFLQAVAGGYFTPGYAAGLFSLFVFSNVMSGWATSSLSGFWLNFLWAHLPIAFAGFNVVALLVVLIMFAWFLLIGVAFVVTLSFNPPLANTQSIFVGLFAVMVVVAAMIVLVAGIIVLRRLQRAQSRKSFTETDLKRIRRVKITFVIFSVAQCLCVVGEFTVTFFQTRINSGSSGYLWIWMGVGYPGLLLSLALFFILAAYYKKDPKVVKSLKEK